METQWHNLFTTYDMLHSAGIAKGMELRKFYGECIDSVVKFASTNHALNPNMSRHSPGGGSEGTQMVSEYCYHKTNKPLWFLDKDITDMLMRCKIECNDLSNVNFPYDVFGLTFEKGIEIEGYPLRSILFSTYKSKLIQRFCNELVPKMDFQEDMIRFHFDFGEDVKTKQCHPDTIAPNTVFWHWFRKYKEPELKGNTIDEEVEFSKTIYKQSILSDKEWKACLIATKIVTAALFYYNARPDLIVPYTLPRSIRYTYKGNRDNFKRMKLPLVRKISEKSSDLEYNTGRTVAAHTRGFVLRHLKDERFKRNPDGTIRTILIEPCVIHPEEWEKQHT